MRRSASVTLVLLPMLAAAVASAQPGPQDNEPAPQQVGPPQLDDDMDISPPGLTPVTEPQLAPPDCGDPATWPEQNQQLGVPPDSCRRSYGVFRLHGGVIRGGFGHYFGTGGG